ncbi:MAG: patatin-like phospholipase family protein [Bacillota bacterium]
MELGLVLSGGGLRGAAHIGVLKVLLENGIKPDVIAGTSAGSIVAALYGAGLSIPEISSELSKVHAKKVSYLGKSLPVLLIKALLGRYTGLPTGLLNGQAIEALIREAVGAKTFEELNLPVLVMTTDICTGQAVVFTTSDLIALPGVKDTVFYTGAEVADAVRASIAIPGIFSPKELAGRILVDGGVVNNAPADILKALGVKKVIAVNMGFLSGETAKPNNLFQVLLQSADIMGERISRNVLNANADLEIHPPTPNVNLWDFGQVPSLVQAGVQEAQRRLPEIKQLLDSRAEKSPVARKNPWTPLRYWE